MVVSGLGELFYIAIAIYVVGGLVALAAYRRYEESLRLGFFFSTIASILLLVVGICVFASIETIVESRFIRIDGFSSIFIIIVGLAGLASSIYGVEYMRIYRDIGGGWLYTLLYNLFLASMSLLPVLKDFVLFIFFWEVMMITSIVLIGWEHHRGSVVRATKKYMYTMLILNSLPLILSAALLWAETGSTSLEAIHEHVVVSGSTPIIHLSQILLLIVFTAKAGLFPLHYWLPDAHPAAPSNASSLLSGVMVKMGVYGIARILFGYLGAPPILAYIVLGQALLSVYWGSINAVKESDGKRVLAYSSVSHIGYISASIALALIFSGSFGMHYASVLLIAAGLTYTLAHSLFKTLLFLASGVLVYSTGSPVLDENIGVMSRDRLLTISLIIGLLAISGLPPLMGFIAKISIYGSALYSENPLGLLTAILLIAASPLTIMYAVKFTAPTLNITVRPRMIRSPGPMIRLGVFIPAALLVLLGILVISGSFMGAAAEYMGYTYSIHVEPSFTYRLPPMISSAPILVAIMVLLGIILGYIDHGRNVEVRRVWTTGYNIPLERHMVSPRNMFNELTMFFKPLYGFAEEIHNFIIWRIPSVIAGSGVATRITSFFGGLNNWISRKIVGFAEAYSKKATEYKLDEAIGSSIASFIRLTGSLARLLVVSPIGLFVTLVVFLALFLLYALIYAGW